MKIAVSCGLGVDSTALLVLLKQQKRTPDFIVFADTGGEKPETYHFKSILEKWIIENNFPHLVTVKNERTRRGKLVTTLEDDCLAGEKLPDIAYGKKGCSITWKKEPAHRYIKQQVKGEPVKWLISFNADEERRKIPGADFEYPLIEADWGRIDCIKQIILEGLPVPPKSACFYCPSSKKSEIQALARLHPDLAERAIALEKNAANRNSSVKGLGRGWDWESIIRMEQKTDWLFPPSECGCVEAGVGIEEYWSQFSAVLSV